MAEKSFKTELEISAIEKVNGMLTKKDLDDCILDSYVYLSYNKENKFWELVNKLLVRYKEMKR